MKPAACPDTATLDRLARGALDAAESDGIYSHLQACDACCATVEALSPGWSLETFASRTGGVFSTRTEALRNRLAATPPSLPASGGRSAAIPPGIPVIPGLDDLEPRARGGMGIVYRARDRALERPVAVKVLWPAVAGSATAWARAKREALLLARISHANVVAIHAAGETSGSPFLVMEWVDGPSLQQRLDGGLPTPRQAARIARDLARALDAVHALGIIHRDIKPDNVLLAGADAADWDRCVPKLADFGLARPAEISQQLTQDAAALGTPASMAPEQTGLAGELGPVSPATDIHGLGGLTFALLTGEPPFATATTATSLQRAARSEFAWPQDAHRLPRDLRAIVDTCLEREPGRRYASAALLAEDLHRFVEGLPVRARPPSPLRRLARAVRRRPVLSAVIGLSAVFVTAALGGLAYHAATITAARLRIDRSERLAEETAGVATRSMSRLTGDLIEQMIRQSRPDDTGHVEFLRQIREEFSHWPLGDDPVAALRFRVQGLRRVAKLFFDVSHYEDAFACHELALAALDELATLEPGDRQALTERLLCLHLQRACLHHLKRMDEATASARLSMALLEEAPADLPHRDRELVRAALDLGMFLHEQRQYDEGVVLIDEALARMRALREGRPDEISLVEQQAHALFTAQMCACGAGRVDDCRRWLDQLVGEMGDFLASPRAESLPFPQRSFLTTMVAVGLDQLVDLESAAGQTENALEHAEARRQLCRACLDHLPPGRVDAVHGALVDAELQVASFLARTGRHDEAQQAVDRAGQTGAFLLDRQPGVWDHAALQAGVCQQQAELAAARGETAAAADWYRNMIALMEPQLAKPACRDETQKLLDAARAGLRKLDGATSAAAGPTMATDTKH